MGVSEHQKRHGPYCSACGQPWPCQTVREAYPDLFADFYEI